MKQDYSFLKHNKIESEESIAYNLRVWQHHLLMGADLQVRLMEFVMYRYVAEGKDLKAGSFIIKIQGYQVIRIQPDGARIICAYSPLAKTLVGEYNIFNYTPIRECDHAFIPHTNVHNGLAWCSPLSPLDPLSDDHSKRLLMSATPARDYGFRVACLATRRAAKHEIIESICKPMGVDDPTLAMVKYIRSQIPEHNRKKLMELYDTYGPIDTVVGDALIHLDKFRSF